MPAVSITTYTDDNESIGLSYEIYVQELNIAGTKVYWHAVKITFLADICETAVISVLKPSNFKSSQEYLSGQNALRISI